MKRIFIPLFCLIIGSTGALQVNAQNKAADKTKKAEAPVKYDDGPHFKFEGGDTYDFGVVKRGPIAMHTFEFTNVGNAPIIIMDVKPSCGCTNVDWPKNPVLPGQKGSIQLGLKTAEQHGVFNKEVYIQSNAKTPNGEKRYTLYIKGDAVGEDPK